MKKIISFLLATVMCLTMLGTVFAAEFNFTDVKTSDWFYNDVVSAVNTGIINGRSKTEFKPDDLLTYAEAIKLAACMNEVYLDGKVTLANGEPWYKNYVVYCMKNGIIKYDYNYDENATRAGYIEIFANALPDEAFEEINDIPEGSISDVEEDAEYADAVYKLYKSGIVTGVDEKHNCNPEANIKRSEVATIISRMMDKTKRKTFDIADDEMTNKPQESDNQVMIPYENPEITVKVPTQTVGVTVLPEIEYEVEDPPVQDTPLTVYTQPEGYEAEEYGEDYELKVVVYGGKAPYSYQWFYYTGYRNSTEKIKNGESDSLVITIENKNTLLGQGIYCEITDSEGTKVKTNTIKIYGPFSLTVEDWMLESGENTIIGRVDDGVLKKGEKISVIRDGKVIATGVAEDLQMFNKSLDEILKGDKAGIIFKKDDGALPSVGDVIIKYQESHVVDTSDIIN